MIYYNNLFIYSVWIVECSKNVYKLKLKNKKNFFK